MKKLFILFAAVCGCMMAQAQTIDAVNVTQGETTDWYSFGKSSRIDVAITNGNPVIEGKIYDLTKGNVETAFGTDPLPPIKEAAKNELEARKTEANNRMNQKAMGYELIEEVQRAKEQGNEKVMLAADAAKIYIDHATNESTIQKEKENGLNAMEEETQKTLAGIQAAIVSFKEGTIDEIKQVAATAKEEIDGLGVDESAKSEAKAQIDNIVNTAEQTINAATSKDAIDNAKTQAIADIHNVVQTTKDMWVTVRTDAVVDNWNTICLERNITAIDGATFWTVSGQDATSFILDEVTEPEAGQGYLIRFTATELKVKYGDKKVTEPVTATDDNPIQGTFTRIDFDQYGQNVLVGNYVVYNNQLCPVEAWVGLLAHRAYVVANLVPNNAPAPAPGRARAYMPKPDQTPTEIESVDGPQRTIHNGKFLRNGQLIIVKDNKMYNVQGMKL